jgi:hypothetical protein
MLLSECGTIIRNEPAVCSRKIGLPWIWNIIYEETVRKFCNDNHQHRLIPNNTVTKMVMCAFFILQCPFTASTKLSAL